MDDVRCQLEKLLAEEIQAKRDEELVRSLQARILSEEWTKREELEKLQQEQRKLLDMERNKTKTFEKRQTEMERQLEGKKILKMNSSPHLHLPTTNTTSLSLYPSSTHIDPPRALITELWEC